MARKQRELSSQCIEWPKYRDRDGYGRRNIVTDGKRRNVLAHRIAWERKNGPVPDGLFVLHKCDNPPCTNVDHLYLGDARQNMRDAVERRRLFNTRKTHCPRGHELVITTARGWRECRECPREQKKASRVRINNGTKSVVDPLLCSNGHDRRANFYRNPSGRGSYCRACKNERRRLERAWKRTHKAS